MANKKLKIDKTIIFNCVTLLISMAALIVSIRSCKVSDDRLKYIQAVDELKITPTLREVVDSDKVVFNASYDNAEVTALRIIFPNKVTDDVIDVRRTPIEVSKLRLENDVRAYIQENIELRDSVITFAEISIPVAVDFLATVYSVPMINRELRTLLFTLYGHDGVYDIEYSNSMLSGKIQIPDSGKRLRDIGFSVTKRISKNFFHLFYLLLTHHVLGIKILSIKYSFSSTFSKTC